MRSAAVAQTPLAYGSLRLNDRGPRHQRHRTHPQRKRRVGRHRQGHYDIDDTYLSDPREASETRS